ncbi:cytochrome P450 4C1-like isoform X1 [Vespula squamosa]|uniref:Cytochrome P450 4C1-like isoform X1 n=1 Tax=Vespula squamosa TaxID=30214 RepID=A0ABD2BHJ7_VESSQ
MEKKESMLRSTINKTQESSEQKPNILPDFLFEASHDGKYSEQDIRDKINKIAIAINRIYYSVAI